MIYGVRCALGPDRVPVQQVLENVTFMTHYKPY